MQGGLQVAETVAPDSAQVTMIVATTRQPSADPGERFNGARSGVPQHARIAVAIPPDHVAGRIEYGGGSGGGGFAVTAFDALPPERAADETRRLIAATGKRHVLVFVHGYNTRFDEAVFRFAQIVHDSGAPVTPVLFSFASAGKLSGYPYDRESAAVARDALEALLTQLARDPAVTDLSVLAHSMGGWLTLESLRQMAIRQRGIPVRIGNVMLAAPDVDVDVAASQGHALRTAGRMPRVTLFTAADDQALRVSRFVWGSRDRLGAIDPNKEPYRTRLAQAGVNVVDLAGLDGATTHGRFAEVPEVVAQIGERLARGQRLGGETSVAEAATATTQGALQGVGNILTAPIAVLAPR
jgi:esterase/lipase superfamily enzyme